MPKAEAPFAALYGIWLQGKHPEPTSTASAQQKDQIGSSSQVYDFCAGLVKGYPTELPPAQLCKYCERGFRGFAANGERSIEVVHNYDFLSIEGLASKGCIICSKIVERLNYKSPPPSPNRSANSVRLGFFRTAEGAISISWVWARTGYRLGEVSPTTGPRKSNAKNTSILC
jgi:hypothetical protein